MKKLIFIVFLMVFWSCSQERNQDQATDEGDVHDSESMEMEHQGDHEQGDMMNPHSSTHAEEMVAQLNVPEKFHEQLNEVFRSSIPMKEAFIASDPVKVKETAQNVIGQLGKVDAKLLEPQAHEIWMQNLMSIAHLLDRIKNADDIEEQRQSFASYNRALYRSFKFLGHEGDPIYYQFCPMAFDNKGAYWLSDTEEIRNPYFGSKMMTCGSTKEVID